MGLWKGLSTSKYVHHWKSKEKILLYYKSEFALNFQESIELPIRNIKFSCKQYFDSVRNTWPILNLHITIIDDTVMLDCGTLGQWAGCTAARGWATPALTLPQRGRWEQYSLIRIINHQISFQGSSRPLVPAWCRLRYLPSAVDMSQEKCKQPILL